MIKYPDKPEWRTCKVHGRKFLPGQSLGKDVCGICSPLKHPELLWWTKYEDEVAKIDGEISDE